MLVANGEIYNHRKLRDEFKGTYAFKTSSDSEVLLPLFQKYGLDMFEHLNGMYGFVIYEKESDVCLVARDPIGIIPLYYGYDENDVLYVASEMKALTDICDVVLEFPAGHYLLAHTGSVPLPYFHPSWKEFNSVCDNSSSALQIRDSLSSAIKTHMDCEVGYGVLLSGGLDSSIISAVAQKLNNEQGKMPLHSFSVGLSGSPDLVAAKEVADHIGTIHHEVVFTVDEGINAIQDVIYHLETYDITTIRAATPMYLMARNIKSLGLKVVLSGEGSDELFGGYLYFHKAPNAKEFHEETVRKLEQLSKFDCLRSNKAMAAWGIESRVPFLDSEFIDVAMTQNPADKMCGNGVIEKKILREAFEDLLPCHIAWRQKEQFSDGVGYSWIDGLKEYVETIVSDLQLRNAHFQFPVNTPITKEGFFYRSIFESKFKSNSAVLCVPHGKTIACSTPNAILWDKAFQESADPSGRAVKSIHQNRAIILEEEI
ncbi:asparagine synthetase [Vibrio ishigakensis]|uniref:asparagine synthase (glutamine-hydrolyzing) n=1 Tax=Vibrio ishigakensis TaxID=1481914 RepID=A0A0B8PEW4_9VIBR|nr:asparagine synthetase [Vibrio ishigakensis]